MEPVRPISHRRRRRFQLSQPVFLILLMVGSSLIAGALIASTIHTLRS